MPNVLLLQICTRSISLTFGSDAVIALTIWWFFYNVFIVYLQNLLSHMCVLLLFFLLLIIKTIIDHVLPNHLRLAIDWLLRKWTGKNWFQLLLSELTYVAVTKATFYICVNLELGQWCIIVYEFRIDTHAFSVCFDKLVAYQRQSYQNMCCYNAWVL